MEIIHRKPKGHNLRHNLWKGCVEVNSIIRRGVLDEAKNLFAHLIGFLPWGDVYGRASIPVERLKSSKEHSAWYPIEFDPTSKKPNSSSSSANKPEAEQQQAPTVSGTINVKIINPMSAEEKQAKHEVKKKKRKERKKKPFRELYDIKDARTNTKKQNKKPQIQKVSPPGRSF